MKKIWIVGVGMGCHTLTQEGSQAIEGAEVIVGAPRLTTMFSHLGKPMWQEYVPERVLARIAESTAERFALLVSGDVGFFSATSGLVEALKAFDVRLVPGISSLSFLFARCRRPWQEAAIVSCHGRDGNLIDTVRRSRRTFALTGGNSRALLEELLSVGFGDLSAVVGERLGGEEEQINELPVSKWVDKEIDSLSVLLIENPHWDERIPAGIEDCEFLRGDVPMTKAEVRAVTMSKLALKPDSICCDIGCGTGSVTVEMALAAYKGKVYAVDQCPEAVKLTKENGKRFHIGNIIAACARAPEALVGLPPLDAAFIGGSDGSMDEIFSTILEKNPLTRIVTNLVTIDGLNAAMNAFCKGGIQPEIIQLAVTGTRVVRGHYMLSAQNPIWIVSGGGHG